MTEQVPPGVSIRPLRGGGAVDESATLSPNVRADLLDLEAWGEILMTYGRTMGVAVALTNSQGQILGKCRNPQPVWALVHEVKDSLGSSCPFCITAGPPCTAVPEALQSGGTVMVRDQAGLTHVAVPLILNQQFLGAIIAGQVFDRYPEPLLLRHVARNLGVSAQQLWAVARKQTPISGAYLQASGDLLCVLGNAFLRQRYSAILEAKLAEANGRFRLLVEGVTDHALFTMDPIGGVTSWNRGAERLLGYVEDEILGQNFSSIFTIEDIQNRVPEQHLQRALQQGRTEDEGWRVSENGKQFWANVNITTVLEGSAQVRGFTIIIRDVTDRKKATIAIEEARQERALLQEKFLSHVSHELRTPLTAIYFFTTNLLDGLLGNLTSEQHEHLTFALDNVKQLTNMVSDLLDLTRVDSNKLTVEPQHTSSAKLVAQVLRTCRTNAAVKSISLCSDVAPSLPFIWADPARVREILTNLIDNGIKFTPDKGTVTVRSRYFAEDDDFLCLSVSDTGCGIGPQNREIIFDRLAQVKGGAETSRSGLGLGLFIARELVLRHGSRIWVESQLGQGSTFYFTMPVFSLAKLCARIFTVPNLQAGSVTLIAVDIDAIDGVVQTDIVLEIRRVLDRCILVGQDQLLPAMNDAEPTRTFFIVACTDASGSAVIASRIVRELQSFDNTSQLKLMTSSTTLLVASSQSKEEQIGKVTAEIDRLVQAHLLDKENLK
jgi:PAS domain S-box-containing protein